MPAAPGISAPASTKTKAGGAEPAHQLGTRSISRTGASATGWRITSIGRWAASAIGAPPCPSGSARTAITSWRSARSPSFRAHRRPRPGRAWTCTGLTWTRCTPLPGVRQGEMQRVPELIDVWFDSGSMPVAQWHYPFENKEMFEKQFPADYIMRGRRPDPRLVLLAARHQHHALRNRECFKNVICLGLGPRWRRAEDVQVAWQRR